MVERTVDVLAESMVEQRDLHWDLSWVASWAGCWANSLVADLAAQWEFLKAARRAAYWACSKGSVLVDEMVDKLVVLTVASTAAKKVENLAGLSASGLAGWKVAD